MSELGITKTVGFTKRLENLLNEHSMETRSNTPDWILAHYLMACLQAFDNATNQRNDWHFKTPEPPEDVEDGVDDD